MVIMLGGRQGLIPLTTELLVGERLVFAYSMVGLFVGYIYFSIPRTILTVMAAAEKLDPQLVEAARSLGASHWRILRDVLIPGLKPALLAAGAICFATSMGAFGTAFTLATRVVAFERPRDRPEEKLRYGATITRDIAIWPPRKAGEASLFRPDRDGPVSSQGQ